MLAVFLALIGAASVVLLVISLLSAFSLRWSVLEHIRRQNGDLYSKFTAPDSRSWLDRGYALPRDVPAILSLHKWIKSAPHGFSLIDEKCRRYKRTLTIAKVTFGIAVASMAAAFLLVFIQHSQ